MATEVKCKPTSIDVIPPRVPMVISLLTLIVSVVTLIKVFELESRDRS